MARKQIEIFVALLVAFAVVMIVGQNVDCVLPFTLASGYEKLVQFFKSVPNSADVQVYFDAAREELNKVQSNGFVKNYKAALENVLQLEQLLKSESKCNEQESKQLLAASKHADGHRHIEDDEVEDLDAWDLIVYKASKKHYDECMAVWLDKFNAAYAGQDADMIKYAEYARLMLEDEPKGRPTGQIIAWVEDMVAYAATRDRYHMPAVHLIKWAQEDNRGCDFNYMYENYLVKPCKNYLSTLGDPILGPAAFDARLVDIETVVSKFGDQASVLQFYKSFEYSDLCRMIVEGGNNFKRRTISGVLARTSELGVSCSGKKDEPLPRIDKAKFDDIVKARKPKFLIVERANE